MDQIYTYSNDVDSTNLQKLADLLVCKIHEGDQAQMFAHTCSADCEVTTPKFVIVLTVCVCRHAEVGGVSTSAQSRLRCVIR